MQFVTIKKTSRHNENEKIETEKAETMKTKKAMKTKTNFRKAALRSAAVVVSFVLVSFTVSAQDFWRKVLINSSFNEIALALIETSEAETVPASAEATNSAFIYLDEAYDPALDLESWMTSDYHFGVYSLNLEEEAEHPMVVEDWMVSESLFFPEPEEEQPLELEEWMTTGDCWGL